MTIKGDPDRLEHYTSITLATLPPVRGAVVACGSIINALNVAPSSLAFFVSNYTAWIEDELSVTEGIDQRPAAFGFALRQLDHFVPETPRDRTYLSTNDLELFNALVAARMAHPDATDASVYGDALDSLTGSPDQLASELKSVITDIGNSMSSDDVDAMKQDLAQLMDSMQEYNGYYDAPLTDLQIAHNAWVALHGAGDDSVVPAALVRRLQTLTELLGRRRFDPAFTTAFFQALGPELTAQLPRAISLSSWSDNVRTSGDSTFDMQNALANVDSALSVASQNLDSTWREALFHGAVDGRTLDDSFPLLFEFGKYSKPFSVSIGQLGLNVFQGNVVVDRGVGSPGYPNFDHLATNWEDRGTMLVATAARNPAAANALLLSQQNASWLTDNKFGREGDDRRHPPDWAVIAASVRELIVAGTVDEGAENPALARDAAVNVINAAVHQQPGAASDALSPAYGQMVLAYLPDFARSPAMSLTAENRGDYISIGSLQAAQFTSLAMHDAPSKAAIFTLRDALDLQTVAVGLDGTPMYPPWAQRIANIDGIVLSGDNGEVFVNAREQDADALRYNQNLDLFQNMGMGVIGLVDFPGSGLVDSIIDKGVDQLRADYIDRDANNVEHAGYTTNIADLSAFDHERLVVAEGQLISAVHAEQRGATLTPEQAEFIDHAEQMLGRPYVDALRNAANGLPASTTLVTPRQLQEWAGNTPLDQGFTDASSYTEWILPHDGSSLWPR